MLSETRAAKVWDNPKGLIQVEEQRYPVERALKKIMGDAFRRHIPAGSLIFEGGGRIRVLKITCSY